jgi:tetratricopeptide (TPR) repeat protein
MKTLAPIVSIFTHASADLPPPDTLARHALARHLGDEGQRRADEGDDEGALAAYHEALAALGMAGPEVRADLHLLIGALRARRGEPEAALDDFSRALQLVPRHVEALEAILSLHVATAAWSEVLAVEERLFLALPERARVGRLIDAAARWEDIARPSRARTLLERALRLRPHDVVALARLRDLSDGGRTRGLVLFTRSLVASIARRYARAEMAAKCKGRAPVIISVSPLPPLDVHH